MIESNPAVAAHVRDTLAGSGIRISDDTKQADCVLAEIGTAELHVLLAGAVPVVVTYGGPRNLGTCEASVLAGAQDCVNTGELTHGRLEQAVRSAIGRHSVNAAVVRDGHASEERYRRIVETAAEGIATVDADFVFTFVNGRLGEMLGAAPADLVGTSGFDRIHLDDVAAARDRWAESDEPQAAVEVRCCRTDGSVLWGLISRTRLSSASEPAWLLMVTDITERKLAERSLAEREHGFRAVFDNAYDAILIADDDRRFVDVNPAACRVYGRTREQMLALRIDDVADSATAARLPDSWARFCEGSVITGESAIVRPDGEHRQVEYASTPNISPNRHLSIVRDATDRHAAATEGLALEHRLNQAERLDTVGQLAGGVAHDFNNILSIIVNYAELARTARDGRSVGEDLDEIDAAAARGRALTRQLLIISRRDVARPEIFDIAGLVRAIKSLLDRVIGDRIEIETALPDAAVAVSADRGRIDQLVMNLALNARDAMPAGGTLSITVRTRPSASGAPAADDVELTVADTGVGMIEAVARRAFEPFFTTKSPGQGVGLGLAAAHGIVSDAGGEISLESRLGEGTTVTVILPGTTEDIDVAPVDLGGPDGDPSRVNRRVLVVEDDAKLLDATHRMLERHGYEASTAENATVALAKISDGDFDVVLTDLVMPGMSGVGLAQRLRVEHPEISVICMSGYSARRGLLPDDVAILEKPFSPQELLTAIARAGGPR
ncbi:MAG: PAS domain S-box protein [Solirubrobacteraceae bacterium]